ncbi:Tudor domain-containing protein 5 [Eufriesea mexicana]|uniref:Tudor domain-containing protein 5 n=1 Tax=Eufriesea mexicana TaxID=516756 RepID=A0A310SKS5_9HYME|nr:Tudor domain-containing protein 5 [Eufriesea mexicana]
MQVNLQKRENIQTTILALLLTQKGGCTLRELDNDYFQLEGMYIPWKDLGYSSLLSFLRSIPKAVKIENKNNTIIVKGIASDKSIHVSKLVAGQKSVKQLPGRKSYKPNHYFPMTAPPRIHVSADILSKIVSLVNDNPDGVNKDYILHEVRSCMPFVNITMDDIENQLQELSHTIFQRNNKIYPIQTKIEDLDHLKSSNDMSSSEPTMVSNNKQVCKPLIVTIAGDENLGDMLNVDDEENMFEFPSTKTFHSDHTKSITKTKPTFSFIEESISKYQDQMAEHISIPKVQYDNNINQTQVEFDNIRRDEESQVFNKDVKILINERMKFRLEKLIQNHFDGIWCSDLPKKYLEEYKVPLNYVELGFNSVREFASQLPEIFHCIQPYSTGDFILYYAKRELPSNKIKEKCKANNITELYHIYETNDEEALPSLDTCKGLIPDNVMNIGESVGYINVANLIQNIKPYIEVVVVEVFTPSFFWIQLYKKQKIFKKFMDDLHNFYTMEYMKYVIPPVVLEKGLNCACIYNGIWHRGIIKTVKPDFQVTVMFYDYGTLKTYPPEAIYYLHRMFSNLPAQAIPCGLINIRPYQGSKWSRNATHNFAIRTCEIPLIAIIASIDEEDNSMLVSLTDTLEEEDVHINDWLVEQKLAAHGKMVCMKKRNFPFRYYLECQEHVNHKEFNNTHEVERNCDNNAALYNINFKRNLSDANNFNRIIDNGKSNTLQSFESNNFVKNDPFIEKMCRPVKNSVKKFQEKVSLYQKLLSLKLKSIHSTKINNNNNYEINESIEKKKFLHNSTVSNISLADISVHNRKNSKGSNNICDTSKDHKNISKQQANYFDIWNSEDELDICDIKLSTTDADYEVYKTGYIDWSVICKNAIQENKYNIPHKTIFKKQDNIPLAENCFLKAVYNSSYSALCDKDIHWSSIGNINKTSDVFPLILKNIERRKKDITDSTILAISQQMLETLTGKMFVEPSNSFKNVQDVQLTNSSQESSDISTGNTYTNNNEIFYTKNLEQHSQSYKENEYICMKIIVSNQELCKKLLSIKDTSSNILSLDSDDLSTSDESISFQNNNNDKYEKDVYENDVDTVKKVLNESNSKIDVKSLSHIDEINVIDLHTQESVKFTISDVEVYEKEALITSPKTSVVANKKFELIENLESILGQQSTQNSDLIQNIDYTEESLLNVELMKNSLLSEEAIQSEAEPVEKSVSSIMTETSHISVFNDIDIETDEEEWDVHVSYADFSNLLKSENANYVDVCKNRKDVVYEVMYSDKVTEKDETKNLINPYTKFEIQMSELKSKEDKVDMNNLLLYVEENLIFRPEQCYEEKTNIFNDNNIPLVSPQSTLHEKCFQSSKPIMFDEQEILLTKKDIQDQILQTDSIPSIFTFSENNTNPFLQDEPPNDQINNNISPQAFMQLWKKNLQLEMQINIILNILHKVINDSVKNVNDNITNDESILNAIKGALLLTENNYREKDTVTNTDSTNVECHPECLTIPATSEQPIITTSYNGDHDSNVGINPFRETIIHNLVKSQSVMDYNTLMPVNDDFDTVNQSLSNQQMPKILNTPPGFEKFHNKFMLDLKNNFTNNDNASLLTTTENSVKNELILKETNPFKLSLAVNAKSFNNKWNVDNIINTAPKIIISDESMQQAVHKKEMEKHCFSPSEENLMDNSLHFIEELYNQFNQSLFIQDNDFVTSRDVPNCETMNENFTFSPNYNEKDSIHSSPFHTLCSSSINSSSIMKQNEIQCNQTSMTNSDQLNSASIKLWNKTPKNTTRLKNCSTICSVPENNEEKVICNEDQQKNSLQNNTPADTVDFEVNTNNIGTKDTYSKETKFKTVGKVTYIPKCSFLNYQVFFQVVELPEEVMHIFYYQGIGWLLINEVIKVFSELELTLDTVKLEHVLNTNAQIKEIDRAENSIIFIQTNSVSSKATYNIIDGTNQLRLIPLKLILKVLYELKIISQEDISDIYLHEKFICNSTAHVIWLITNAYRHFKYYIENGQ